MNQTTMLWNQHLILTRVGLHSITKIDSQAPLRVISLGYLTSVTDLKNLLLELENKFPNEMLYLSSLLL